VAKLADAQDFRAFTAARLDAGASPAEINRELSVIRRAFSLAVKDGVLMMKPFVPMLKEQNVRQGFVSDAEVDQIIAKPPEAVRPVVRFAFVSGWRAV
jgi:site-specific recombinase XerD